MKILRSALIAAAVLVPGSAMAAPSILGPTGVIYTPNADVVPAGCLNLGYHWVRGDRQEILRNGNGDFEPFHPSLHAGKANIGLGNRFEIGIAGVNTGEERLFLDPDDPNRVTEVGGTEWLFNGKLSLLGPRAPFLLAAGVIDALDQIDRTPYVYGGLNLGARTRRVPVLQLLPTRLRAGAGYGWGMIDGVFVNAGLPVGPNLELLFEWLKNEVPGIHIQDDRQINVGARLRFGGEAAALTIDGGMIDFDEPFLGASLTFCPGGARGKGKGGKDHDGDHDGDKGHNGRGRRHDNGKGDHEVRNPGSQAFRPVGTGMFRTW